MRFRTIFQHAPTGIAIGDLEGCIVQINRAFCQLLGYTEEELRGQPFEKLVHPDDQAQNVDLTRRVVAGEMPSFTIENRYVRKNGTTVWVQKFISTLPDDNGSTAFIMAMASDITARRAAEEAARTAQQAAEFDERRLEAVLDAMPAGIAIADDSGKVVRTNRTLETIWGGHGQWGSLADYVNWKGWWVDTGLPLGPDDWAMARAIRTGEVISNDVVEIEKFDGSGRVTIINAAAPIRDSSGRVVGGVLAEIDITAQRRAEERLRQSEAHFRELAEAMPQLVWTADANGTIDYYSSHTRRFLAFDPEPGGADAWYGLVHPDDLERMLAAWQSAVASGEPYQVEHRTRMRDGSYRWHLSRAYPSRDSAGRVVKWFGVTTDIDDQKRAQEVLERTVEERTARLRESISELEHFSYTITHDMRAPLRAMQGFGHILLEEYGSCLDDAGRDYLRRINEAAERMDHLIVDALDYSKAVRADMPMAPLDPGAVVRGIVESYPMLQAPRACVEVARNWPLVMANYAGLVQCFSNLLTNAVKFVAPDTMPSVNIWPELRGEMLRIWVEDNGIGIPKKEQRRVFDMFQRLSKSYEGTGIGLALVQKVVTRMKGTVGVESEPGRGSRFWVELQIAQDPVPEI